MSECVILARHVAREIGERLSIPTFLYECAATDPARQNLTNIRGKGFEELRQTIGMTPEKTPDFGPRKLHPTAGGTAVAARDFLITFNVYLDTDDLGIARSIARAVRGSSGGYSFCKAAGFDSKERNCVQVAMSLTNPARTPIYRVLEAVKREAQRYGVHVTSSEVVGLAPLFAISETAAYYLQIERWKPEQIIETAWLEAHTTSGFLEDLASRAPTPGGGSASAYAGALGAALCGMVGRLNDKKTGEPGPLHHTIDAADALLARLNTLMVEDVDSFNAVVASWNLPDEDPNKNARKQEAQQWATRTPLETMAKAIEVMKLAKVGLETSKKSCLSDAGVAAFMAHAALEGARLNVLTNLPNIADEKKRAEFRNEAERLHNEAEAMREEIDKAVEARCS